jgi:phosphoesterase RecJ-like protein
MTGNDDLERVAEVVRGADSILLTTHVSPDGDGIGSGLGLARALSAQGKQAALCLADPIPPFLDFLEGASYVLQEVPNTRHWDLVISLDCGEWDRLGGAPGERELFGTVVNLDHHRSNERFGDIDVILPEVAATGMLAYWLLERVGARPDPKAAQALYTAIATDTGFFCYSNTNTDVFEVAAELTRAGASPYESHHAVHENHSPGRLHMMGEALRLLEYHGDGRIGILPLDGDIYQRAGATPDDAEGLVELPRSVASVEVAVMIRPMDTGDGFKASLRSKRQVDVSQVAEAFGGGGHARAAGCRLDGPLENARDQLVAAIQRQLNQAG